jgi:hypothetical protein
LPELLVVSALLLLITGCAAQAFRASRLYHTRVQWQTEMEDQLIMAMDFLAKDMGETSFRVINLEPNSTSPTAITLPIPRNGGGVLLQTGSRVQYQQIISYRWMGDELRRYQEVLANPLDDAPNPRFMTPPRLGTYFTNLPYRVLARGVKTFAITPIRLNLINGSEQVDLGGNVFRFRLELERKQDIRTFGVDISIDVSARTN